MIIIKIIIIIIIIIMMSLFIVDCISIIRQHIYICIHFFHFQCGPPYIKYLFKMAGQYAP